MSALYLVRHGQASFGAEDYDNLSARGVEQSRLLGRWLTASQLGMDLVAMGAQRRHRQTAEAAAEAGALNGDAVLPPDPAFNEFDHHEVLIRARPDLQSPANLAAVVENAESPRRAYQEILAAAVERWASGQHDDEYTESWNHFQARCLAGIEQVVRRTGASRNVILFTSGGVIAAVTRHVLGLDDAAALRVIWSLVNTGVTRLLFRPGEISVSYLNAFPHLEQTGQRGMVTYR